MAEVAGVADLSSHPLAEGASKAMPSSEAKEDVLVRQRVMEAQEKGIDLIEKKKNSGFFNASDKADAKKDADRVLEQAEKHVLDSDGLKSFFSATSSIGAEATEIERAAAENMRVKVGDSMLTMEEWRAELDAAKKPADGSVPDPQKIQELENGVFGYTFPKESAQVESENAPKEKTPEEKVISDQRERLEEKLKKTGNLTDREQQLLRVLRIAEKSESEARPVIQGQALRLLQASGALGLGLDKAFESINQKIPAAMDYLKGQGLSKADIETGLNMLGTEEAKNILSQWGEAFVGKELSEKEIKELVATEKKKGLKSGILLALLLAAIGPMELVKQVVPMPGAGNN